MAPAAQRLALERGRPFAELAAELGIEIELERLVYYAHWITPEAIPQRFDTRFFLAVLPSGQTVSPSPYEIAEGLWIDLPAALARAKAGELQAHFATLAHLRRLAAFAIMEELLEFARTKPVVPVMPLTRQLAGRVVPYLPPDLDDVW